MRSSNSKLAAICILVCMATVLCLPELVGAVPPSFYWCGEAGTQVWNTPGNWEKAPPLTHIEFRVPKVLLR